MQQEQIIQQQKMTRIAEYKVSAQLLSSGIITAKPDVDINGADLLAIIKVQDGAKFARIQCKGRTLRNLTSPCSVKIKQSYVTGTFTCLLYIHCLYRACRRTVLRHFHLFRKLHFFISSFLLSPNLALRSSHCRLSFFLHLCHFLCLLGIYQIFH